MADTASASRVVLLSTAGTAVLTLIGTAAKTDPTNPHPTISSGKQIIGTVVVGIMLAGLAQAQPDLAQGLGALMLVTTMFVVGQPAWEAISHAVGASHPSLTDGKPFTAAQAKAATAAAGPAVNTKRPISGAF